MSKDMAWDTILATHNALTTKSSLSKGHMPPPSPPPPSLGNHDHPTHPLMPSHTPVHQGRAEGLHSPTMNRNPYIMHDSILVRARRNSITELCLTQCVIYKATLKSADASEYIGLTDTPFKTRYDNHTFSFRHETKSNATTLAAHVWKLGLNPSPDIKWEIIQKCHKYTVGKYAIRMPTLPLRKTAHFKKC